MCVTLSRFKYRMRESSYVNIGSLKIRLYLKKLVFSLDIKVILQQTSRKLPPEMNFLSGHSASYYMIIRDGKVQLLLFRYFAQ